MRKIVLTLLILLLVAVAWSATFQVDESQFAVVTRFGEPIRVLTESGLQFKWPAPVDRVTHFDARLLALEYPRASMPSREYLTQDRNVEAAFCICWRIHDDEASILRFFKSVGNRARAEEAMGDIAVAELGAAFGRHRLTQLISADAKEYRLPVILNDVRTECQRRAGETYGIEIVDVRLTRLNFPMQNRRSVFDRMRAERQRLAQQYRSEGESEAMKIRAAADRQRDQILAEAFKEAEQIRGKADAQATAIYAEAVGQDPEFYEFLRTLELYTTAFNEKTVAVFSADNPLLKLLNEAGFDIVRPGKSPGTRESDTPTTRPGS
ncbi:MAG: protease modulator HflC [Phycisphaerae bacterium]|nr:protease modulator HflC [Phycisphaerae bacterium]